MMSNKQHEINNAEKRTMGTIEVREADTDELVLEGYAAVFNSETDLGPFREVIRPGAFSDVLTNDVRALINHDANLILGRTSNGTLELEQDERGLKYRVKLGNQTYARDFYESVKRGDISQSSFAFTIEEESWNEQRTVRSVNKVRQLLDVSPVTYPAYAAATVQARDQQPETEAAPAPEVETPKAEAPKQDTKTRGKNRHTSFSTMTTKDMVGLRQKHYEEHVALTQSADKEGRELTAEERSRLDFLETEIDSLDERVKRRKAQEEMITRQAQVGVVGSSEQKEIDRVNRRFSLSRAILAAYNQKPLEGAEAEWHQEARGEANKAGIPMSGNVGIPAKAQQRALGGADEHAATTGSGSAFVPTIVQSAVEALWAPSVAQQVGTTVITGATGNLIFPKTKTKPSLSADIAEGGNNSTSSLELDSVTLSPRRASYYTQLTQQLMLQGGNVDEYISRQLANGINQRIDAAFFATVLGATGVTDNSSAGADTTLDAALVYAMEKDLLANYANLDGAVWVMSPKALELSRSEAAVSSVSALHDGGRFAGYNYYKTPHVADTDNNAGDGVGSCGQLIFANFQQSAVMALFGGLDIFVDRAGALAVSGEMNIHLNRYYDCDVTNAAAISICTDCA
jgi:HK97 family phage prohead protease/HK97 family phage major capsid protein